MGRPAGVGGSAGAGRELGFEGGRGRWGTVEGVVFEDTPRLLKILVMVGGDGGGLGRATLQMPRLLQFYYKVDVGGVWAMVEVRRLLKFV